MNCHQFIKEIYLADMLSEEHQRELLVHRQECEACNALASEVINTQQQIGLARKHKPVPVSSHRLTYRIMNAVEGSKRISLTDKLFYWFEGTSIKYAFTGLSIMLLILFVYEWDVLAKEDTHKESLKSGVVLDSRSFTKAFQQRRQHERAQPASRYLFYKSATLNKNS